MEFEKMFQCVVEEGNSQFNFETIKELIDWLFTFKK